MIVSRIEGGLGNQMFQYAFGLYVAKKHGTELRLDLSSYSGDPIQHGYLLDRFSITAARLDEVSARLRPRRYQPKPLRPWLPDGLRWGVLRRFKQRVFGFDPRMLNAPNDAYLVGYWQSEKFFQGICDQILAEFQIRVPVSAKTQQVIERMHAVSSIGLHIRRGDYLTNPEAAKLYTQVPMEYYARCVDQWATSKKEVEVFVFSNDLSWCRKELRLPYRMHFIDHVDSSAAYEDMLMMSHCEAVAIANSTFSWWAAYLNQRSQRTVYAPSQWFCPNTMDASDIYPEHWTIVDWASQFTHATVHSSSRAA